MGVLQAWELERMHACVPGSMDKVATCQAVGGQTCGEEQRGTGTRCCRSAGSSAGGCWAWGLLQLEVLWLWPEGGCWVVSSTCSMPWHHYECPSSARVPLSGHESQCRTMGLLLAAGTPCLGYRRARVLRGLQEWKSPVRAADSPPSTGASLHWGEPPAAEARVVLCHRAWPYLLPRWPRLLPLAMLGSPAASSWLMGWGWTAATQLLTQPRAAIPSVLLCPARGAARRGHAVPACCAG